MVDHPEIIFRLFESNAENQINPHGIYNVWLCIDGKWNNIGKSIVN